jgi:glucosamine--fructose-6-phosphate aminotransferase (isomerizing)
MIGVHMQRGRHTYEEIMSQGQTWKTTLDTLASLPPELINWLRKPWKEIFFIGCGSTYYLSLSAASIWQSISGISTKAIPSSELWLFPRSIITDRPSMLMAVSRSGETSETLQAIRVFRERCGDDFASITCYGDSELAQISSHLLVAQNAEEKSVAQTRSFSSMYVLAQCAAGITAQDTKFLDEIRTIPDSLDRLVAEYTPLAKELGENQSLEHFVFLGSGANYGLACEAMLKMKEMSLSVSEAFHFLEFRHGPKSMITPKTLVIGLLSDSAFHEELRVLSEIKALGATVLAAAETAERAEADHIIELRSGVGELARSPLMLPILQLMAYYRSMSKGLDPDFPKNLEAVVKFEL